VVGSLRGRLRNLERAADERLLTFVLEDGTMARFREEAFTECFLHEYERGRRHHDGEEPGPAHPLVEALRKAKDLQGLMAEHGTILGHLVGEDAIIRGEMERPGPPVEWNEAGTVCE
jgi:hypothetical protein